MQSDGPPDHRQPRLSTTPNLVCELGWCFEKGVKVRLDYNMAVRLYRVAAGYGDAKALFNLGLCYQIGLGVEPNHEKSREYYQSAGRACK